MKKIISVLLATVLAFSAVLSCSAMSWSKGLDEIKTLFQQGYGPSVDGIAIDYHYYEPENNTDDSHPLVIFFPGNGEGDYEGDELSNGFPRYASDQLSSRFTNGGAYLMFLRSNEDKGLSWDGTAQLPAAKAAVDDFIANHNVDESRIYVIGWSFGGTAALNYTIAYTNQVAAVVSCSPCAAFTSTDMKRLSNTAVWLFTSKNDLAFYSYALTAWSGLKSSTEVPEKVRLTTYDTAPNAGGFVGHLTWNALTWDFDRTLDDYTGMKTVDARGEEIEITSDYSFIGWLCSNSITETYDTTHCSCTCHKAGFSAIIWKILRFFYKLFGTNKTCDCGISHY